MKNCKLTVSKTTDFNFKADLGSFQADSGLSRLLLFHAPKWEQTAPSPFLRRLPFGFCCSQSAPKMGVIQPPLPHKATTRYTLPGPFPQFLQQVDRSTACLSCSLLSFYSALPISQSLGICFYPYNKLISSAISQSYIISRHRGPSLPNSAPLSPS